MISANPILTKEERDILILVAVHPGLKHLTNEEIGERLGITVARVKTLLHQACLKLGADNRNEATLLAIKRGEINLSEVISVDELADLLSSLDPDVLRVIANLVRYNQVRRDFPQTDVQLNQSERKRSGILTNRERDVLILASRGLNNQEIADKLCMSTSAVRMFLYRAFTKLGARKRADAIQLALKKKEISFYEMSSVDELACFLSSFGADSIEKMAQMIDDKSQN